MLEEYTNKIREAAKRLLKDKKVDCVLGYRQGTIPLVDAPYFAYTEEDCDNLIWSSFCTKNLANFLIKRQDKVAVVAQGCVSRSIVGLINENQVKRENVYILGIWSPGMVDRWKVIEKIGGKEIYEAKEEGDKIIVSGDGFEEVINKKEVLRQNCLTCVHRNAVLFDEFIGEKGEDIGGGDIDNVAAPWENLSIDERWEKFRETFKDCIRCYACRNVCPLCYCSECFVDESRPQWCGKTQDEADVYTFHILRAFHCAGRCVDCGACESACPMGIKMRVLTSKIEKDIRQMYDYQPGMEIGATPPLSVYRPNDPEEFITP
ncbi:4Fe-4S dicluster domain-containing protein [Desulfothermus okinawensis JCM 13304]